MNQPTDRMLIDALCIMATHQMTPVDLERDPQGAAVLKRARDIVGHYAPMATARILREQGEQAAKIPLARRDQVEHQAGGRVRITIRVRSDDDEGRVALFRRALEARDLVQLLPIVEVHGPLNNYRLLVMSISEALDGRVRIGLVKPDATADADAVTREALDAYAAADKRAALPPHIVGAARDLIDATRSFQGDTRIGTTERGGSFTTTDPALIGYMRLVMRTETFLLDTDLREVLGGELWTFDVTGRRFEVADATELPTEPRSWMFTLKERP